MQTSEISRHYDVVVVGGGMVGASFACALDHSLNSNVFGREVSAVSILVVEAFQLSADAKVLQPSFDARTTALSYGSSKIFQSFGLWQQCADAITEIKDIHVSDRGHFGSTKLSSQQFNEQFNEQQQPEALGFVIENRALGGILINAMQSSTNIELFSPARVESIKPQATGMELNLEYQGNQQKVLAGLVVLADGGKSPVCRQLGITMAIEHYQQHAMIANIAFSKPHKNVAYERFTDSGPLAVLPLETQGRENRGALIWTVQESESESLLEKSQAELIALLQEAFGYRLGRITRIGERFCYPLTLRIAKEQIRPGLVLLGNVAHTLHPVAGQGLNLALRDIATLVQVIAEAQTNNESPGSMTVLQKYLDRQRSDQDRTINFTHYMTRLFSSNRAALVWARKFGLFSIDLLPTLKQNFARQAMGLADR